MDPSARLTDVRVLLIIHSTQRVHEGSRGIDNTFGSDIKFLPYEKKQHQSPGAIHLELVTSWIINLSANPPPPRCNRVSSLCPWEAPRIVINRKQTYLMSCSPLCVREEPRRQRLHAQKLPSEGKCLLMCCLMLTSFCNGPHIRGSKMMLNDLF